MSRGLLGFGSALIVSRSQLRWNRHLEMVARVGGSYSSIGGTRSTLILLLCERSLTDWDGLDSLLREVLM